MASKKPKTDLLLESLFKTPKDCEKFKKQFATDMHASFEREKAMIQKLHKLIKGSKEKKSDAKN